MDMAVNARDEERHLGLGLSLSLGIATAAPAEVEPPPQPHRAISVAPISSFPAAPQWSNGPAAGLFFSPSSGMMDPSMERKHRHLPPPAAATCHSHEMPFLRGIDVNRAAPAGGETRSRRGSCGSEDEEAGASSPNSTLSSLSGKRRSSGGGDADRDQADRTPRSGGGGGSDDEDSAGAGAGGGGSRKKLRLSKDQAAVLEESFKEHSTLNPKQKAALAKQLNLKPRQVEVWFQNRKKIQCILPVRGSRTHRPPIFDACPTTSARLRPCAWLSRLRLAQRTTPPGHSARLASWIAHDHVDCAVIIGWLRELVLSSTEKDCRKRSTAAAVRDTRTAAGSCCWLNDVS